MISGFGGLMGLHKGLGKSFGKILGNNLGKNSDEGLQNGLQTDLGGKPGAGKGVQAFDKLIAGTRFADTIVVDDPAITVRLFGGDDILTVNAPVVTVKADQGADTVTLKAEAFRVSLGTGDDTLVAHDAVHIIQAGRGNDIVALTGAANSVYLGQGDDTLKIDTLVSFVSGGIGDDLLVMNFDAGAVDIDVRGKTVVFSDRFTGTEMRVRKFETFEFDDRSYSIEEIETLFGRTAEVPAILVGGGTQTVTVSDPDPSVSVVWDRVVQQAVIESDYSMGPTVASRAYAMMHTAMYDAWASYDDTAVRVSFDAEGDNITGRGGERQVEKAMSYAAITVLRDLFPDMEDLYVAVMEDRYGFDREDDGSRAAKIGIDAGEDILALRTDDGSNQTGGYAGSYTPTNPSPLEINDIAAWTPENVPIDPEDGSPEQGFLTPQWLGVESFALDENETGETDFSDTLPAPPQAFFTEAFAGSTLDFDAATITLGAPLSLSGATFAAGQTVAVTKDLIGPVINEQFINQALEVVDYSANLTDEEKIIAEFWEDGGGTAFPPGTFMTFAQFVSARDGNTLDQDAQMFFAMANAVMDAGIATWQAKVFYDYVRPVRAIRDLGELGLIGELGVDENTGETGYVIEAFGGFNEDGTGRGTQTILAENFITFQRPGADPSPPFAEYTSGHSAFSAAGAEVLRLFTGSDNFGGSVTFAPDSIQFEAGVPWDAVTLSWETFTEAADEAGLSRLYGGIHFAEGDLNGRDLGREVGAAAYDLAQSFIDGTATDQDRPFWTDGLT